MKNLTDFRKTVETGVDPRLEVMQRGSKTNPTFQHVNKQSRISPNEVLQS